MSQWGEAKHIPKCMRCEQSDAVTEGLCGHCHWVFRSEVDNGLVAVEGYLGKQAAFADYLRKRKAAPEGAA